MHAIIMVRGKKMVCGWFFRLIDPVCGTRSEVTTLYVSRVPNVLSDDAAPWATMTKNVKKPPVEKGRTFRN